MKKTKLLLSMLLFAGLAGAQSLTPQVVASGGSYSSAGGYSLSSTVGELSVTTVAGGSNILTQGFQQPIPDNFVGIIDPADAATIITLYPNPAHEMLSLSIQSESGATYKVIITDVTGREVSSMQYSSSVIGTVHTMDVTNMAQGYYLMVVRSSDNKFSKTISFHKI